MERSGDILIVDDEPNIVDFVAELLRDEGYSVRLALDGETALAAIEAQPPALILLDLFMPRITGAMLHESLRLRGLTDIPIVMMSASPRVVESLGSDSIVGYLPKPFDLDDLLECVSRYVSRNGSLSGA